jgi:YHS domain-containing protein
MNTRPLFLLAILLTAATVFAETPAPPLTKVEAKKVCMINEQFMNRDQIPVEVNGKTYYGCCAMCKDRLTNDASKRVAVDPVSGKTVDKAKAVIGAASDGMVVYFANEKNLKTYNKRAAKK